MVSNTIMPEAACTSTQVHLQVRPDDFAGYWNAAQAIAGVQVALGANSPFLFREHLVAESRIPLFEQSTDTRSEELKAQGVGHAYGSASGGSPRSSTSSRRTPGTSQHCCRSAPTRIPLPYSTAAACRTWTNSGFTTARSTRWNRPVYDISDGEVRGGGESRAAGRANRGGHHGQRGLLRRPGTCLGH